MVYMCKYCNATITMASVINQKIPYHYNCYLSIRRLKIFAQVSKEGAYFHRDQSDAHKQIFSQIMQVVEAKIKRTEKRIESKRKKYLLQLNELQQLQNEFEVI